jgi:hypothetical protein
VSNIEEYHADLRFRGRAIVSDFEVEDNAEQKLIHTFVCATSASHDGTPSLIQTFGYISLFVLIKSQIKCQERQKCI